MEYNPKVENQDLTNSKPQTKSESQNSELMDHIGNRIRSARKQLGIPRRVLSENSGVSHRYLAQLESGKGNITIELLQRVATALNLKLEWLLSLEAQEFSETVRITNLLLSTNATTRSRLLQVLERDLVDAERVQRVCLVGLRGAGKSTLGAFVEKELNVPFVELNKRIEYDAAMPISEIIALYGLEGLRNLEANCLEEVINSYQRVVLAVGGGIVTNPATYGRLLAQFHTIWIKAKPEEHMERVRAQGDLRPMDGNPAAMSKLKSILGAREEQYKRALVQLDTSGSTLKQSQQELIALIKMHKFLN